MPGYAPGHDDAMDGGDDAATRDAPDAAADADVDDNDENEEGDLRDDDESDEVGPPESAWSRTWGGPEYDQGRIVVPADDDGYFVVGWTQSFGSSDRDIWIIRLDEEGHLVWQKRYGGPAADEPVAAHARPGGELLVAASTESFGSGEEDVWLLMIDGTGAVLWQKTYGGPKLDKPTFMDTVYDGNVVVLGLTESFMEYGSGCWVLVVDTGGSIVEETRLGHFGDDVRRCTHISMTSDGGYIMTGQSIEVHGNLEDMSVTKLHGDLTIGWQYVFGGDNLETAFFAAERAGGGYRVLGNSCNLAWGWCDVVIIETDWHGILESSRIYGGSSGERGCFARAMRDGGFIVGGTLHPQQACFLARFDESSALLWQRAFFGATYPDSWSGWFSETGDGGIIAAGYADLFGEGVRTDVWAFKTKRDGSLGGDCPEWLERDLDIMVRPAEIAQYEHTMVREEIAASVTTTHVEPVDTDAVEETQCGE